MRICGADAGDGGSRGRQARRESARAAESARGESCSLSLSLSRARAAARPAGRESAEAALEPATGPQPDATDTHLTRETERGRERSVRPSEHSLSHRDYIRFSKETTIAKKSMLRQNRESSRGESPRRTPTRRHLDLPTPARARHTAPAPGPRRTDCGGITEAPVDPPGTRRHTSSPPARWPVQGYQFLYINYTPSAMSHVDVRQHIDIIVRKTHTY